MRWSDVERHPTIKSEFKEENMSLRTIMIFPEFDNIDVIKRIRKQYDPLYELVNPHITLVFPFEDEITKTELKIKLGECLKNVKPFKLVLQGVTKQEDMYGNYLFLTVIEGKDELIEIHNKLYLGIWGKKVNNLNYIPHMTVGKFDTIDELNRAFAKTEHMNDVFKTNVQKVSVEMIGENEESIIIIVKQL